MKKFLTVALVMSCLSVGCSTKPVDGEAPTDSVTANTVPELPGTLSDAPSDNSVPVANVEPEHAAEPTTTAAAPDVKTTPQEEAPAAPAPEKIAKTESEATHEPGTYEVKKGDTLMQIAFQVYGDVFQWKKIYSDNKDRVSDPMHLTKGTHLRVDTTAVDDYYAGFDRYLIKNGDTLGIISDDVYGTTKKWKKLWKSNEKMVRDPNRIFAGFFLRYLLSEDEKNEALKLKESKPKPLATDSTPPARTPSSTQKQ